MKDNFSEWAILECTKCNQIFSTPSVMIIEDGENYKHLICPYCGTNGSIDKEIIFQIHKTMDCKIRKVIKWEVD